MLYKTQNNMQGIWVYAYIRISIVQAGEEFEEERGEGKGIRVKETRTKQTQL